MGPVLCYVVFRLCYIVIICCIDYVIFNLGSVFPVVMIPQRVVLVADEVTQGARIRGLEVHHVLVSFQVAVGIISFRTQIALPVPEFSVHKSPVAIDGTGIVLRCF
jgi:hypothetical protein